jgi:hypothetical protein
MDYKNDMDEFIRETLRSSRRIRDKNFSPIQNTVASSATSSSTFSETQIPLSEAMRVRGGLIGVGGGDSCSGLSLYVKSIPQSGGNKDKKQVWISGGTVGGVIPNGVDPIEGKQIAAAGTGNVWAGVRITDEGEVDKTIIDRGTGDPPEDTDTDFYYLIGAFQYDGDTPTVNNFGCGSINVTVCRKWYASEAPYFNVYFAR